MEELDNIQDLNDLYIQSNSNILALEHWSINTALINYLRELETRISDLEATANRAVPKNIGFFRNLDVAGTPAGTSLPVSGDILSAVLFTENSMVSESFIICTMRNNMGNTNYYVRCSPESQGSLHRDNDMLWGVFRPLSATQFYIAIKESAPGQQILKIHLEVITINNN